MSKLLDMFTQAHRTHSSSGMGFVGKNKPAIKPRAAALIVELTTIDAASAETTIRAGADGLIFTWDGKDTSELEALKQAIDAAQTSSEHIACGLHLTGGWDKIDHQSLDQLKSLGVNYIVLPLDAPARLLTLKSKEIELVVTVPMREGNMYPLFIRNVTAFSNITAVRLDFQLAGEVGTMTIEDALHYRAVREAVQFPALLNIRGTINETDAYTLLTLGIQALILTVSDGGAKTQKQIKALRELLEKVYQDDKEKGTPTTILGLNS